MLAEDAVGSLVVLAERRAVATLTELVGEGCLCQGVTPQAVIHAINEARKCVPGELVADYLQAEEVEGSLLGIGELVQMLDPVDDCSICPATRSLDLDRPFGSLKVVTGTGRGRPCPECRSIAPLPPVKEPKLSKEPKSVSIR